MTAIRRRRRPPRRDRATQWSHVLRGAAVANYENALQAARSLWLASGGGVDRSEFNTFARSLDLGDRYRGLLGIAGARRSPTTRWRRSWPATGPTASPGSPSRRLGGRPSTT